MNVVAGSSTPEIEVLGPDAVGPWLAAKSQRQAPWADSIARDLRWLPVLEHGLRQEPYLLIATDGGRIAGVLPLAYVRSVLFGRFLVGLPYLNSGGVWAQESHVAAALIEQAGQLADRLDVRYLELRHEQEVKHPLLNHQATSKVHMRLALPDDPETLWSQFKPKVRNQVRKGEQHGLTIEWGRLGLLSEFYDVFAQNMRDLGTPVYSVQLFRAILDHFADEAELCLVRRENQPVAAALLLHGPGRTEVPSASSLRAFNTTNANMLMYWNLLKRSIQRGQQEFDFGRSSRDSGTFRFKKQWGAQPAPAVWQYYVRRGDVEAMRPDSARNRRLVKIWQRLPVWLTRYVGPTIVRGIP